MVFIYKNNYLFIENFPFIHSLILLMIFLYSPIRFLGSKCIMGRAGERRMKKKKVLLVIFENMKTTINTFFGFSCFSVRMAYACDIDPINKSYNGCHVRSDVFV